MAKKKQRPKKHKHHQPLPRDFLLRMGQAEDLIRRQQWLPARSLLEEMEPRYPKQKELLIALGHVYAQMREAGRYEVVCQRLCALQGGDAPSTLALAAAHLANSHPLLALRTFRRFLERWPDHPEAGQARGVVTEIEARLPQRLVELGVAGPHAEEVAALHEETVALLQQGQLAQARQTAERLLQLQPQFAPAWNNTAEAWFHEGQLDQAIAAGRRVLAFDPDNANALSALTRYLCLAGRLDEARPVAESLRPLAGPGDDLWLRKAEAFGYLGDWAGVLEALRGAEQAGLPGTPMNLAFLYHLAAVAAYRLGREDEARSHWGQALRRLPGFELTQDNLNDLDKPIDQQHAPWPFTLAHWVRPELIDDITAVLQPQPPQGREAPGTAEAQRVVRRYPLTVPLVPMLLDRGDTLGREFAARLALALRTPKLLAALRDFALGQRGPDDLRVAAANAVALAGLLPPGPVRLWLQGEWTEPPLLGFELHGEALRRHTPAVDKLFREAMAAGHRGEHHRGEQLLREALTKEPNAPDLLNNLAAAVQAQGRLDEALDLFRDVQARFPDYLFGHTGLANLAIADGNLDQAEALLAPLRQRRRFHYGEFAALCMAEIQLSQARGDGKVARSWLALFERACPDHPALESIRRHVQQTPRDQPSGGRSSY